MRVYLVRHGDAVRGGADATRPLSERGRRDVEVMAAFLARAGVKVARVLHSGRKRALETAVRLAEAVGPGRMVEEVDPGLAPDDPIDEAFAALQGLGGDTMIVGHMPFLGRLAARLTAGDESLPILVFATGTVVCLERQLDGGWSIAFALAPAQLGQPG